jgi:nitrite reductase/ring-hydroxylating ferredoxin subunit
VLWAGRIEQMESLDAPAQFVQKLIYRMVPQGSIRKDALSGTWLGRPLHPLLTDVVIGAWISAFFLDVLGDDRAENAADQLLTIGNLAALPTVAAGLSDWAELWGGQQRLGSLHALGNATALVVQTMSSRARRSGSRGLAKLLSLMAVTVAGAAAYLGGHLSFVKGVGVNQTAFEPWPPDWTPVIGDDELPEGTLVQAGTNDVRVMLYKEGERVYALSDRCTHRGCPLHLGQVSGSMIECPCHGSIFRLEDGEVVRGPATVPAPSYEVRRRQGKVEIRLPVGSQWGRSPTAGR